MKEDSEISFQLRYFHWVIAEDAVSLRHNNCVVDFIEAILKARKANSSVLFSSDLKKLDQLDGVVLVPETLLLISAPVLNLF